MTTTGCHTTCVEQIHDLQVENEKLKAKIKDLEERIIEVAKLGLQNMVEHHERMYKLAIGLKNLTQLEKQNGMV